MPPSLPSPTPVSALFRWRQLSRPLFKGDAYKLPPPLRPPHRHHLVTLSIFLTGISLLGGQSCFLSGSRNKDGHWLRAHDLLYVTESFMSQPLCKETIIPVLLMRLGEAQ